MNESLEYYENYVVDEDDKNVKYEFSDEFGNEFLVQFKNDTVGPKFRPVLGNSYELTYFAKDPRTGKWSIGAIVSTNIYKVVQTVIGNILPKFLETRPWVSTIRLEGLPKDGEVGVSKRTRLYQRFLERNPLPGFRIQSVSANRFNLEKNKK